MTRLPSASFRGLPLLTVILLAVANPSARAEAPHAPSADAAGATPVRSAQRLRAVILSWNRDPFTRGAAMGELSGLVLSGIVWDPTQPIAIINGEPVRVSDQLEGYQVLAIAEDHVSLSDGGQTFQLRLAP